MPKLSVKVLEKWSNIPVMGARVYVNDVQVMSAAKVPMATNHTGEASLNMTTGTAKVCVSEPEHETECQTISITSSVHLNFIMTPIGRAL